MYTYVMTEYSQKNYRHANLVNEAPVLFRVVAWLHQQLYKYIPDVYTRAHIHRNKSLHKLDCYYIPMCKCECSMLYEMNGDAR